MTQIEKHNWTEGDDLVAFYMSRHGTARLPLTQAGIAKLLGMSEASLIMRQRNFGHLDSGTRLSHAAKQTRRIYHQFLNATEATLHPMVLGVLQAARRV